MPNFDAGHYFLTVLAPVRTTALMIDGQPHSHRHVLKKTLARMPTRADQMVAGVTHDVPPFARTTLTHFARFVVLDDVVFNGRVSGDALVARISGDDPLTPQKVDRLSTPFLIFVADFDAADGSEAALRRYAAALWDSMRPELMEIFGHCIGFETVTSAESFFAYLRTCQVETTMPFNDYWVPTPTFRTFPALAFASVGVIALLAAVYFLFTGSFWLFVAAVLAVALVVFVGVNSIMTAGQEPFPPSAPPSPISDLPTVLKALHIQGAFAKFAVEAQALGGEPDHDAALHSAFATFLARTRPEDVSAPTQRPAVIGV